ncbi:MAG: alkaline phosphatase family protein, partial [Bacteroidaceae bacterium]
RLSGDILVKVAPGWRLVNETHGQNRLVRESYLNFPIFFYGLNVKKETVETPVTTDCIAATLASIMRIRAPNACHTASLNIY